MNERDDEFLRKAFQDYQPDDQLSPDFNQVVIQKIKIGQDNFVLIRKFLSIYIPALIVCSVAGTLAMFFYGNTMIAYILTILPMLKPWHLMVGIGFIYFHFVRSVLFLAFIYLKKQFNFAFRIPSFF